MNKDQNILSRIISFFNCHIFITLSLIVVFASVIRIIRLEYKHRLTTDELAYSRLAEDIYQNKISKDQTGITVVFHNAADFIQPRVYHPPAEKKPPLLILIMVWGAQLGFSAYAAGICFNILCGSLLVVPSFIIGKSVFKSNSKGLCIALITATIPYYIRYSTCALRDIPYIFFSVSSLCAAMYGIEKKKIYMWSVCGCFTGLAAAMRFEWIEAAAICIGWLTVNSVVYLFKRKLHDANYTLLALGLWIAAFAVITVVIDFIARNYGMPHIDLFSRYAGLIMRF